MRFLAPARTDVAAATFDHPVFSPLAPWRGLLDGADWPGIDDLDARLSPLRHASTGRELHLVDQAGCALDGQHYETRIHAQGRIATRTENWHDLFNALAWKRLPAVKSALNSRQVADIARNGARQRTRGQDAMTQFDEAGAIVVLRDTALLAPWDAHDWQELFLGQRQAWLDGTITLVIVGHALHEHALAPAMWLVAKTLVIDASRGDVPAAAIDTDGIDARAGAAIDAGDWLRDPPELRPLPVSGIPGWREARQDATFYRDAPCFRPRRAGRAYPPPRPWQAG